MVPPLAHAFLALADDDTLPDQRTLPRVVVAAIAAFVLAARAAAGGRRCSIRVAALSSKFSIDSMSDTTVAAPPPWEAGRRPRPTWGLDEGDELAPGRTVLRRIGGGRRYEAMLVWDEHRLAVLVAKVLRPDQARDAGGAARPRPRGRAAGAARASRSSCARSAR